MSQILSPDNLNRAYLQVVRNKGVGGVDRMDFKQLLPYLHEHKSELIESIRIGRYKPNSVRRVDIAKDNGKKRLIGIPTVVDRFAEQGAQRGALWCTLYTWFIMLTYHYSACKILVYKRNDTPVIYCP